MKPSVNDAAEFGVKVNRSLLMLLLTTFGLRPMALVVRTKTNCRARARHGAHAKIPKKPLQNRSLRALPTMGLRPTAHRRACMLCAIASAGAVKSARSPDTRLPLQNPRGIHMSTLTLTRGRVEGMTSDERRVIFASSLGTVFEWYDFYLYATLAPFFAALFFPPGNDTAALLSAFATYAAG